MWFNILIACAVGLLTYGMTVYFDRNAPPPALSVQKTDQDEALRQGQAAPDFEFTATDGKTRKLSDFRGRVVILNFWASWCPPCLAEFPALLQVAGNYDRKDVVLIALSSDHDLSVMQRFLGTLETNKDINLHLKNVLIARDDENRITQDLFQTFRLPETIIIGRDGTLRHKLVGADWNPEMLKTAIEQLQ